MGIVRLRRRDGGRLSTDAWEQAGLRELSEAVGVDQAHVVGSRSLVDVVDTERARHSTADRLQVRRDSLWAGET